MTAMKADGFNDAIIGVAERCGSDDILVYDAEKCIEILVERDGMSYEEACEYFSFNVSGAYVGEGTPTFVWVLTPEEALEEVDEG